MIFGAPEWLFLLPALVVAGWRWRGLRLHEPLRAAALAVLVLALAEPRLRRAGAGLDLWVLADRSESAAGAMAAQSREIEAILEHSRGADDRIYYVFSTIIFFFLISFITKSRGAVYLMI